MGRINNKTLYPIDNNPESIDFLVGTNDNDGKTMSYPLGVVAEFIGEFIDDRETNHIIALGEIEVLDDNKIKINVAEGGNIVYVDGAFRSTQDPSYFNFTPIEGGIKYLYIYASNDPEIFHMIEGENGNIVVGEILPREVLPITVITLSMGGGGGGYVLPIATESKLGGIKVGETLTISSTGILDYILDTEEIEAIITEMLPTKTSELTNDGSDGVNPFITEADLPAPYELPIASSTVLGGVKVGSNLTIDSDGVLNADASFPSLGDNGDVLVKDDTEDEGVKWETLPNFALDSALNTEIVNRGLADNLLQGQIDDLEDADDLLMNMIEGLQDKNATLTDKMLHYWNATVGRWTNSGVEFISTGIIKLKSLVLENTSGTYQANQLGTDGTDIFFGASKKKVAFDTQVYKPITGNVTIDDSYHGAICRITANAIITFPSTLRSDFITFFESVGTVKGTMTEGSSVTFDAPFGKVLSNNLTGYVLKSSASSYRVNGSFATT